MHPYFGRKAVETGNAGFGELVTAMKKNTDANTQLAEEIKSLRQRIAELEAAQQLRERVGSLPQARGESETSLSDLVEATHDLVQSVAPDGQLIFVNRAWRETLGYTVEDVSRLNLRDIIHPDHQSYCTEVFSRVLAGESIKQVQTVFMAKDGKSVAVEGDATGRYVGGKVIATQSVFRDVTERKQAEAALDQRFRELEALNKLFQQHLSERFAVVEAHRELLDLVETQSVSLSNLIKRARSNPLPELSNVVNFEPPEHPRSGR